MILLELRHLVLGLFVCLGGFFILWQGYAWAAVALLLGITFLYICYRIPQWVFLALIPLVPITRFPGIPNEYVQWAKYGLFLCVLLFWLWQRRGHAKMYRQYLPFDVIFILFVILMGLNVVVSIDSTLTFKAMVSHTVAFGYFYLAADVFCDREYLQRVGLVYVLTGSLVSAVAILQFVIVRFQVFTSLIDYVLPYMQRQWLRSGASQMHYDGFRTVGTFFHANMLGAYLAMLLPMAITLVLLSKSVLKRVALAGMACIMVFAILSSASRGAFLNVAVSLGFITMVYWKRIPKIFFFVVLFILLMGGLEFREEIVTFMRLKSGVSYRDVIWANSAELFYERPWTGWGLGALHQEYLARFGFPSLPDHALSVDIITSHGIAAIPFIMMGYHAHNLFLNYAAEMGVIGCALIASFFYLCLREYIFLKSRHHRMRSMDHSLIIAAVAMLLGSLAHSFFDTATNFYDFSMALPFMMISGMGMGLIARFKERVEIDSLK